MANHNRDREDDWARRVRWERGREGPYRDYGWEPGESVLPEFRDPSVSVQPYERERVSRWRNLDWDAGTNTGRSDVEGPFRGVGPKNYRRPDERIQDDVCERLTRHGQVDARRIEVEVRDGEVMLKGSVASRREKRLAEDAIQYISGVKDISNYLKVQDRAQSARDSNREPGRFYSGRPESGRPGGGQGRVEETGGSGVYPASSQRAPGDAEAQGMASWGQGERGAAGRQDHGESEIHPGAADDEE